MPAWSVQCVQGLPSDSRPDALSAEQRQQGWRPACQCQVIEDLQVHTFDPQRDGQPAEVAAVDWLSASVLRLRLDPAAAIALQRRPASGVVGGQCGAALLPRQPAAR